MIIYFANRGMDILGLASTELGEGFHISDDTKTEDIDTGVAVFECTVHWTADSRILAKTCVSAGNYLLRSNNGENEFYTIIEVEEDTKDRTTYVYAEDAGMDLLNETVGAFEANEAHPASWYINTFAEDSGFVIGINEISSLSRKLEWTGEATVAERIASVATQFDNAEIGYSFDITGLTVTSKYINIYKQRGQDAGVTLRLNREVDRIVTTTSVADLATALYVTGGTPEGEEDPVTLVGYSAKESDGDIYTDGDGLVKSKSALAIWSRYVNPSETGTGEGHIVHQWSYDTTSQSELYNRAVTQLKKVYTPAVNYDIEITNMPDVGIGDYVYIVDEGGEVYLQARVLQMETSVCDETQRLTLGDYLINSGGLASQVGTLTTQVASLQSQATSTAADVYNLNEEVSELSSSTVKSSESVEVTLYNSTGTATGKLSFSSGMSLSLSALFSEYATQNWVENKNYISTSDSVSLTISNSYGSASGTLRFSSGLSLDIKDLFSNYALLSATAQIRLYSDYGYASAPFGFQSPLDMSIQTLLPDLSGYATQKWVEDQGYLTSSGSASTAEKLKTAQTFALTFDNSNLDSHPFDGSDGVSLAVDNLLSRNLTFTGSDKFTKTLTVQGSYGEIALSGSLVSDADDGGEGVGIITGLNDKSILWATDDYVLLSAPGRERLDLEATSGWGGQITIGYSDNDLRIQSRDVHFTGTYVRSDQGFFVSSSGALHTFIEGSSGESWEMVKGGAGLSLGSRSHNTFIMGTTIYMNGTEWSSDERLKTAIEPLKESELDNLTPVSFRWEDGDDKTHYGYIAQDVREHIPELVGEDDDGMLYVAYTEIIPLLHIKINELENTIETLEERIAKLEAIING